MAIILDLETLAIDGAAALAEPVSAPANYKKPEAIASYIEEAQKAQIEKAGLFPWTTRIIALGWCEETDEVERVETCNNEAREGVVLDEFFRRVEDRHGRITPIVTFNGLGFDLLVIQARARLLGVRCPFIDTSRYRSPHPDLMKILTFDGAIAARSLQWYCRRFGISVGDGIKGNEIAALHADENWPAIEAHCADDVRCTRQLAERIGVLRRRPVAVAS